MVPADAAVMVVHSIRLGGVHRQIKWTTNSALGVGDTISGTCAAVTIALTEEREEEGHMARVSVAAGGNRMVLMEGVGADTRITRTTSRGGRMSADDADDVSAANASYSDFTSFTFLFCIQF